MYTPGSDAEALEIYRKLCLIRQCQETIIREYDKDEMKTPVHLGIGLEGISVGVAHCLPPNTKSFGQLRNHGQYLSITGETDKFFGELYGKVTGTGGGKAGSMHLTAPDHGLMADSGIVASTIPLAVGAAFAAKYRGTNEMAVAMFGDGAVDEGEFWESLNFACLHQLRVLFLCENNELAIYTYRKDRQGFKSLPEVMKGFDCYVFEGEGDNVLEVIDIVQQSVDAMVNNPRPAFVCLNWYRPIDHVGTFTDYDVFRPKPSEAELQVRDPVYQYEEFLKSRGMSISDIQSIRDELQAQIEGSIERAKAAPSPTEDDLWKGVFA